MRALTLLVLAGFAASCTPQNKFPDSEIPIPEQEMGPGSEVWDNDQVQCSNDGECGKLEACIQGICQLRRCGDEAQYNSAAPLGQYRQLAGRNEFLIGFKNHATVGSYLPKVSGYVAPPNHQWKPNGSTPVDDVTGGNFFGVRQHSSAALMRSGKTISVMNGSDRVNLQVSFTPKAIAAGNILGDERDELIVLGDAGEVAVCDAQANSCEVANLPRSGWEGLDVATGDVDGDGRIEVVFLVKASGKHNLAIWNVGAQVGGETPLIMSGELPRDAHRVTAGDLDGNGIAEILTLSDGGYIDLRDDTLSIYGLDATGALKRLGEKSVSRFSTDIAAGDLDGDRKVEVALLNGDRRVDVYRSLTRPSEVSLSFAHELPSNLTASNIYLYDMDGDSPTGRLVEGPRLVPGDMVPLAVLTFPPFSRTYSDGIASVGLGNSESQSLSTTVSMSVGHSLSMSFSLSKLLPVPEGLSPSVALGYGWSTSTSQTTTQGISIGSSYSFGARVERYGNEYAGVVLACACFHSYTYEVEDPKSLSGVNGEKFTFFIPVGGTTGFWSSKRYNAVAQSLGNLPIIEVKHTIGDPFSYPQEPVTLEHEPISPNDMVFPKPPTFRTSDVGQVGWSLGASQSESNSVTLSHNLSLGASLGLGIASLGYTRSQSWSSGISVSVGQGITFSGTVPGVPDNPRTPEDEYKAYAYSFTPYVYKAHYADVDGNDAAYYTLYYSVRR